MVAAVLKCVEPAFMLSLLFVGVTPGQEIVNVSLAGMGICAQDPAPFTRMERDAATTAIARMMRSVPLSTERASVQQVCISVACMLELNSVLNFLNVVITLCFITYINNYMLCLTEIL